jgi:hypothetical protein
MKLSSSANLFNWAEARRIRWKVNQLDSSIGTQLRNTFKVVKRYIIHNQDRLWPRPSPAVPKELLDKILEHGGIR